MTVKLTKDLPTEAGLYYWKELKETNIEIVEVEFCDIMSVLYLSFLGLTYEVKELGGYWAKVDESMFEVVE